MSLINTDKSLFLTRRLATESFHQTLSSSLQQRASTIYSAASLSGKLMLITAALTTAGHKYDMYSSKGSEERTWLSTAVTVGCLATACFAVIFIAHITVSSDLSRSAYFEADAKQLEAIDHLLLKILRMVSFQG